MKLTKKILANTFALFAFVIWIISAILVYLFPVFFLNMTSWMMMGMKFEPYDLTWFNFFWGGILFIVWSWIGGYIFGWCLEYINKKTKE